MKRHYTSPRSPFVWVKDAPPEMPDWIRVCPQPAKSRGGALVRYPLVSSRRALLWMVDYGCVDMHVWLSRCDRPDRPDQALVVHTTGGDGMHVHIPLARAHTFEQTRTFAYAVGRLLDVPGVNVDAKMNGHGQQIVSPYSARPPDLFVATPLTWEEVEPSLDPRAFTTDVVLERVRRHGDLAAPLLGSRQRLPV